MVDNKILLRETVLRRPHSSEVEESIVVEVEVKDEEYNVVPEHLEDFKGV
jgi:hypothetical protein